MRPSRSSTAPPHAAARSTSAPRRRLQEYVGELRALGAFTCGLPVALRFIRERVQSLHVAPERPRPGHLYVCTLSQSGYAGRPHLFVVGLEEGRVFSSSTEDAVLLDAERAAISADSAVVDRQDRRSRLRGARAAGDQRGVGDVQLLVSRHARVPRDVRLLADAAGLSTAARGCRAVLSRHEGGAGRAEVGSASGPRDARSPPAPWWLRSVVGTGEEGVEAVAPAFDGVAHGLRRGGTARHQRLHRVRRLRAGGGRDARSVRTRHRALGHRAGEGGGVSVPILPEARAGRARRRRARAGQGRLARSADARIGAARPVRRLVAPHARRQPSSERGRRRLADGARAGAPASN